MHATRAAPIRTVSTGLLGSPYGVFVGLRVSTSSPSRSKPLPRIRAQGSLMRRCLVYRIQPAHFAPVPEIIHAAAEYVDVVDRHARKVDMRPAAGIRHPLHDEHGRVLLSDTDARELGLQRAQRVTAIEDVVDDEHRASLQVRARPHSPPELARCDAAAVSRHVHVVELVRKLEAPTHLYGG